MNRRSFLALVTASALESRLTWAQVSPAGNVALTFGTQAKTDPVPHDFVGLSYESAQLANPRFFSVQNKTLISLFRELAPQGNLRLGGGSSEFTTFSAEAPKDPPPFEVFGPDTSKTVKTGTVTSAQAIQNLRGFLDAVQWSCLYGLNLGQGSVNNAVAEAKAAQAILGPRLLAFQIGNEPDSFRKRYRPESYTPADYIAEWTQFHDAIAKAVPGARFAGPDISNKLPYLTAFAEMAPQHSDVVLLTSHYCAMGPASRPEATLDNLLDPDPKFTTLKRRDLHVIEEARERAHLPYRMSEGNSCWDGGKPGVSDTFGSALWCADYMLACMSRGWNGVNLHGGGNGYYTPIAGTPTLGFTRRPEFFGIQFAQEFSGSQTLEVTAAGGSPRLAAYAFQRKGQRELVLINKTADQVTCSLPQGCRGASYLRLHAPAIDAKEGVRLSRENGPLRPSLNIDPYTAVAYRLKR